MKRIPWLACALAFGLGVLATRLAEKAVQTLPVGFSGNTPAATPSAATAPASPVKLTAAKTSQKNSPTEPAAEFLTLALSPRQGMEVMNTLWNLGKNIEPGQFPNLAKKALESPAMQARARALWMVFTAWANRDPAAARAFVSQMPESQLNERSAAFYGVADGWPASDSEGLLDLLDDFPLMNDGARSKIYDKIALRAPQLAMEHANRERRPAGHVAEIFNTWLDVNPAAAGKWLTQQPPSPERDRMLSQQIQKVAATDPGAALPWIDMLSSASAQDGAIRSLAEAWTQRDRAAVERFISIQQDSATRTAATRGYIEALSETDPSSAGRFLSQFNRLSTYGELATKTIINWMQKDRPAALQWATSLPDQHAREALAAVAAMRWSLESPAEAVQWLASNVPAGDRRDKLLRDTANEMIPPQTSLRFATLCSNPAERQKLEEKIVGLWLRREPSAAAEWLDTSDLPEGAKTRLRTAATSH